MRTLVALIVLGIVPLVFIGGLRAAGDPPAWAYAIPLPRPAGAPAPPPDTSIKELAGSTLKFTRQQISDGFGPADWFPGDHPPMPDIVAHGKRPDARACALCHYPNGKGRQENAGVVGSAGLLLHPADERLPATTSARARSRGRRTRT